MKRFLPIAWCCLAPALAPGAPPEPSGDAPARQASQVELPKFTVGQDAQSQFRGTDETPILAAAAAAHKAGGGIVVIDAGTYRLRRGLRLVDVCNVHFRGLPGAVLELAPATYAVAGESMPKGASTLAPARASGLAVGQTLRIFAPGAVDAFTKQPANYFTAEIAGLDGGRIRFAEPLPYEVRAGTQMLLLNSPNLFDIGRGCEGIHIADLTLDGGLRPDDPRIPGHAERCGVYAQSRYSYEKGLLEPPIADVAVQGCTIRNCLGRGVAFYGVQFAAVEDCTISDTLDEAIDFDHFTRLGVARRNKIARCRVGIELNDARECVVEENEIVDCEIGLNLWRFCKLPGWNEKIAVARNRFDRIAGTAVAVGTDTAGNLFEFNQVLECGRVGFLIRGREQQLNGNTVLRAGRQGIVVEGERHRVTRNRVLDASAEQDGKYGALVVEGTGHTVEENDVMRRQ